MNFLKIIHSYLVCCCLKTKLYYLNQINSEVSLGCIFFCDNRLRSDVCRLSEGSVPIAQLLKKLEIAFSGKAFGIRPHVERIQVLFHVCAVDLEQKFIFVFRKREGGAHINEPLSEIFVLCQTLSDVSQNFFKFADLDIY